MISFELESFFVPDQLHREIEISLYLGSSTY